MANEYPLGNRIQVTGEFVDDDDVFLDPAAVYCQVRNPQGVIKSYTYGTADPSIVKSAVGHYLLDVDVDIPGKWVYRWYSTGNGKAADEDCFTVDISEIG